MAHMLKPGQLINIKGHNMDKMIFWGQIRVDETKLEQIIT